MLACFLLLRWCPSSINLHANTYNFKEDSHVFSFCDTLKQFYRKHLRLTTSKHGHFQRLFLEIVRLITLFKSAGFPIQKSLIQNHKDNCFISLQDLTPKFVLDFYIRPMRYMYQRKKTFGHIYNLFCHWDSKKFTLTCQVHLYYKINTLRTE